MNIQILFFFHCKCSIKIASFGFILLGIFFALSLYLEEYDSFGNPLNIRNNKIIKISTLFLFEVLFVASIKNTINFILSKINYFQNIFLLFLFFKSY